MNTKQGFVAEERAMLRGSKIDAQTLTSFANWYPVTIAADGREVWWRNMHEQVFVEAFFQDTLAMQDRDARQVCSTPLAALSEIAGCVDSVKPAAFIFHVSRCGSTLLTQMLAGLEQCIVLSEPPAIDAFFRLYHDNPDLPDAQALFRQLVAVLGQRRCHAVRREEHFFIKFDSWHLPWLDFIREAFPEVVFIFLYREPQAVLASHRRQRGPQMIPGLVNTTRLQPDLQGLSLADHDGYTATMLLAMLRTGLEHVENTRTVLLNYQQLPSALWQQLLALFAMQCDATELDLMEMRSRQHSKYRNQVYTGDTVVHIKDSQACEVAMERAQFAYEQLEQLRLGQKK